MPVVRQGIVGQHCISWLVTRYMNASDLGCNEKAPLRAGLFASRLLSPDFDAFDRVVKCQRFAHTFSDAALHLIHHIHEE